MISKLVEKKPKRVYDVNKNRPPSISYSQRILHDTARNEPLVFINGVY